MKRKLTTLIAGLAMMAGSFFIAPQAQAQNSNLIYSATRMPQSNLANPALYPSRNRFYLALPGVNINFQSPLSFNNIFEYQQGDTAAFINMNHLLDTLGANGNLAFDLDVPVAGVGLDLGKFFLTANVGVKLNSSIGIPVGLSTFLNQGNVPFRGAGNELYLLDGNLLDATLYAEAGVAAGLRLTDNLTVGARFKVMDGYFNMSTVNTMLRLYTSTGADELRADINYQLRSAGCIAIDSNNNFSISNYIPNNYGVGFDIGARFENDLFDISASINDIASTITWSENVKNIVPSNGEGSFSFTGLDLTGLIQNGSMDTSMFNNITDTIMNIVTPSYLEGESYKTHIPTKFNLSGMVKLGRFRAGALFHGEFDHTIENLDAANQAIRNNSFHSSTSIVGEMNIADWVEILASFSVVDDGHKVNWFNPGLGVSVSLGRAIQIYGMMDYISNLRLVEAKSFNVSLGLNLLLSNTSK